MQCLTDVRGKIVTIIQEADEGTKADELGQGAGTTAAKGGEQEITVRPGRGRGQSWEGRKLMGG